MSSLRLALKQSLQDAGIPSKKDDRKKKNSSSSNRRRPRRPGDPPRKRGRPRKHPKPSEPKHSDKEEEGEEDSSENEFSYDSEEEESHEEEEEEDREHEEGEVEDNEDESKPGSAAQSPERTLKSVKQAEEGEATVDEKEDYLRRKMLKKAKKRRDHEEAITPSDEERRRQRKLLKKQLKHSAANMIQNQWKKKRGQESSTTSAQEEEGDAQEEKAVLEKRRSPTKEITEQAETKKRKEKSHLSSGSSKSKTVPPPEPEFLEWSRGLSEKRCRKHIAAGMRVKVRFATKAKRDGKVVKKRIWYGGRVSAVSKEGSKIRIKYDDGTSEISKFPDKDVVVDETCNGQHLVPADKFIPRSMREEDQPDVEEEEFVGDDVEPAPQLKEEKEKSYVKSSPQVEHPSVEQSEDVQTKEKPEKEAPPGAPANFYVEPDTSKRPEREPVEMTPKKISADEKESRRDKVLRDLGSPEEGELSPGLTHPSKSDSKEPSPTVDQMEVDEPSPEEISKSTEENQHHNSKVTTMHPETKFSNPRKDDEQLPAKGVSPDEPKSAPRSSLTIRITNIKRDEKGVQARKAPVSPKPFESDSEGEVHADTPVTERQVRSIEVLKEDEPTKRKRAASDESDEAEPAKKRMALSCNKDVVDTHGQSTTKKVEADATNQDNRPPPDVEGADKVAKLVSNPSDAQENAEEITKSSNVKNRSVDETGPPLALPTLKIKRRKERSNSPNPRGRTSPVLRNSSPAVDVPTTISANELQDAEAESVTTPLAKPASQVEITGSGDSDTVKALVGSKNSAFSGKPLSMESMDSTEPPSDQADVEGKGTLVRSIASTDSLPSSRSGRRAAQQAKEKLNSKQEQPSVPESGKKKKKRRRKEGDDGDESDESVDDRQWVQCDSCGKWRILPSSVKISSLPKHWYCRLNTYDAKRSSCAAPEQTAKQAAKEWRRARKRLKQQKLEQTNMENAPLESTKEAKEPSLPPISPKPPKPPKKLGSTSADSKRSSPTLTEEPSLASDSGSDTVGKKGKKGKPQDAVETQTPPPPLPAPEPTPEPKKPGRKRGRPARNQTQKEKDDGDNVEWVQCEKCEKWRKLPPYMSSDELPDTWYCSMNTWNPVSASCESPEDKADAHHHEVGNYAGLAQGAAGKYSYRSMIFGTGRKHNRPMSERSRAAESLFMRPIDDEENPHPTVMYSKSSAFLPRTSNFTKSNAVEEKTPSIFEVMSNSDLWAELRTATQPMDVLSINSPYPKHFTFDNLPFEVKQAMREVVMQTLDMETLTGDHVIAAVKVYPWGNLSADYAAFRPYFNADIIVNTLLALVRDGLVEMTCLRDLHLPMAQWVPKYRKVRTRRALEIDEAMKASRCMKIAKPWKQREETNAKWISGGAAFA